MWRTPEALVEIGLRRERVVMMNEAHAGLIRYEAALDQAPADVSELEFMNRREAAQAENLVAALAALPDNTALLVWVGNHHHCKEARSDWLPIGYQFRQLRGSSPFVIDQLVTVAFPHITTERRRLLV